MHVFIRFSVLLGFAATMSTALAQLPIATGKAKFLGGVTSSSQTPNFVNYFNQVTPENGGKWGSVEGTRDVMNWSDLDAGYNLAKANGFPFKMHTLTWGNQQPAWIESLSSDQQLLEIKQWYAAVAARYPDLQLIDVVNEPLHAPPSRVGAGNYINALGGSGASGWDWVLSAFRLARTYFPNSKLLINEYSVTNDSNAAARYIAIIKLLQAENLIDGIGIQAHAFETTVSAATTLSNLNLIAATGLPIYVSELDIDGSTEQIQLDDYKRIFPVFWEHPSVVGVTLWGYRPGLWRDAQGAALVHADGTDKLAMTWLKTYLANAAPTVAANQVLSINEGSTNGTTVGVARGLDADGDVRLSNWQITGGSGAGVFAIDAKSGRISLTNASALNASATPSYTLNLTVSDGRDVSPSAGITVQVLAPGAATTRLINLSVRTRAGKDDKTLIMGFVVAGSGNKQVLVRGLGPLLANYGVSDALVDPQLKLFAGGVEVDGNDNWSSTLSTTFTTLGATSLTANSKDAALLRSGPAGVFSAQVASADTTTGIALAEVYDVDKVGPRLVNVSARSEAGSGDNVLVAGFVLEGVGSKTLLIRGLGPTLSAFGVSGALANPQLKLFNAAGAQLAQNGDWGGSTALKDAFSTVGAVALTSDISRDAALLVTLPPGVYSVQVSGVSNTTGVGLVEIYEMP
jgi:GH35 family endo-1,4-beta-xylanase